MASPYSYARYRGKKRLNGPFFAPDARSAIQKARQLGFGAGETVQVFENPSVQNQYACEKLLTFRKTPSGEVKWKGKLEAVANDCLVQSGAA